MHINTEQFLRLQQAAKGYMLDKDHPERMGVIAKRGKGETSAVKIKLFNTVKAFLEDGGWGEEFYGENVPQGPNKTLIWAGDKKFE